MSKGWAVMSLVFMCLRSISNFVLFLIYPDVDRAGWSASAHESRIMLCANFLLIFVQLKVWSPHWSCVVPHLQRGGCSLVSKTGNRSFCWSANFVLQLVSLCCVLLLHIPTSGYEVCGERILGSKCMCCLVFRLASLKIWDVTRSPKSFFNLLRALRRDILDSKTLMQSSDGHVLGQHKGAICGTKALYLCRLCPWVITYSLDSYHIPPSTTTRMSWYHR